ncbi:hypothetical protein AMK59_3706 [Oryctes borbonicus]|uniref:F-box domain-containing protein n=1 Tax=Oryctes borbonicus TaxID=1629725 RepID=A0A0T6B8U3_9SCAR|nr:hypothetical protein AMK59_3706 [Oryctes borbonicus]
MSRLRKGKRLSRTFGDVTLNDFANSTVCKNRLKKSSSNVTHVIKELEEDNKGWDEKLDELEGDFVETRDEDGNVKYVLQKTDGKKRSKSKNVTRNYRESQGGYDYPMDIWFLISEYIGPEDVGRFAGICKTSFAVTNTAKFWFNLYKRYYKSVPNLPERLQPECMLRFYGIRTSVVRALYYMYPPFVERLRATVTFEIHPDCLNRRLCICMWFHKQNAYWYYCFKLKENNIQSRAKLSSYKKPDLIEMLEDVTANCEEHCRILEVSCKYFIAIPTIQGLTLNSALMTLSPTFRHHKLQMVFGSGATYVSHKPIGSSTTTVIIDGVINVKILDWWHPSYPHNHNIDLLLNND